LLQNWTVSVKSQETSLRGKEHFKRSQASLDLTTTIYSYLTLNNEGAWDLIDAVSLATSAGMMVDVYVD
jgi:hypothetical protein